MGRRYTNGNDLFKRRQYFWQRRSFKIYVILAGVAALFIFYLLFWSGIFKIEHVTVSGAENVNAAQIEQIARDQMTKRRFGLFSQSNLWFFSSKIAVDAINQALVLDRVKVKKRPLKTLKIELQEKSSQITLVSGNHYYYLDPNGLAIQEILVANVQLIEGAAPDEAGNEVSGESGQDLIDLGALNASLPLVYDLSNTPVTVGQKILEPERIVFINQLQTRLPAMELPIKQFSLPEQEGTEVRVLTQRGFEVYFNSADDLNRQLANLNLIVKEKLQNKNIHYIDLRFGEKVYIK
ncbi:FtsQ-type POTRA domain-containing protein [Candidatus Falkowbacteria bacterium]|nr:FtsQ-type POTRA domain-containing protein [Candidatus Falkowbacteria bacterium]